jgi:proline iminopeptidase
MNLLIYTKDRNFLHLDNLIKYTFYKEMVLLYKIREERHFYLKVDDVHTLYIEESGNPNGIPLITLHGGPGIPMSKGYQKLFNGNVYRIISFHQRGCGLSSPRNTLIRNKTKYIVEDIELIRKTLGIKKWLVEGISWGATLAIIYGIMHPHVCLGLVIGGFSLMAGPEKSTQACAPDVYNKWMYLKSDQASMKEYLKKLQSSDPVIRNKATKMWNVEEKLFELMDFEDNPPIKKNTKFKLTNNDANALALLECYYYMNHGFVPSGWILNNAHKLNGIPGFVIHGRYDLICSCENSFKLSKVWKSGSLKIVEMAGHSFKNINNLKEWHIAFKHFEKLYSGCDKYYSGICDNIDYKKGSYKIPKN